MRTRPPIRGLLPVLLLLGAGLFARPARSTPQLQESADEQAPRFAAGVDVVTVDVVVVDGDGNPLEGLRAEDFEIAVDGQKRPAVRFEAVSLPESAPTEPAPVRARVSTNVSEADPARPARTFVVVFDNVHMAPDRANAAKKAVETFVMGLGQGDLVTLVPTSGGAWWSGRIPEEAVDLVGALARLRGERPRNTAADRISDYEAMRLHLNRDPQVGAEVSRRYYEHRILLDPPCPAPPDPCPRKEKGSGYGENHPVIRAKAAEVYEAALARKNATLLALARAAESLAGVRGRKAILLVSEGFIEESNQPPLRDAFDAARRANAAFYFLDVRGLTGLPATADAEIADPTDLRDMGSQLSEGLREAQGAVSLAVETGGFAIQNANDLARGLSRLDRQSRSYYLVGIEPEPAGKAGAFHEIDVKVRRPDVRVLARKGYYDPSADRAPPPSDAFDPGVRTALDSPFEATGIPLRLSSSVGGAPGEKVPMTLQAEVDPGSLTLDETSGRFEGVLETVLLVASRDTGERIHQEVKAELSLPPDAYEEAKRTWLPLRREVELSPGTYQAHLLVRNARSGHVGSVRHVFSVPGPGEEMAPAVAATEPAPAGIPLRARPYVFEHDAAGKARVLLVIEADPHALTFRDAAGHQQARVEIDAEIVPREGGDPVRHRTAATIRPDREKGPALEVGWARALTTVSLAPGGYEARLTVRDTGSTRRGNVEVALDVPAAEALRACSPILTDTFLPAPEGQVGPPIPLARHRFQPGAEIGMFFEVYGTAAGAPVEVAYRMLREDGTELTSLPRQPLPAGPGGTPGTMIMLPLAGVPEGRYELVVDIRQGKDAQPLEVHAPFEVGGLAPVAAASGGPAPDAPSGPRRSWPALVSDFLGDGPAAVVAEVAGWSAAAIAEARKELERDRGCDVACLRAAVLVHAEAAAAVARRGDTNGSRQHEVAARAVLDDPRLAKAPGAREFRRGFLVALGHERRARSLFNDALELYGEALKLGDDAGARLGEGTVHESLAFSVDLDKVAGPDGSRLDFAQQRAFQEAEAKRAEDAYRKALDVDPALDEARLRLGRVLALRGKGKDARKELLAAAASQDAYVAMLANVLLGQDLMAEGRTQAALERFRAAASGPSAGRVQLALSYGLLRAGRAREARESIEAALAPPVRELDPWLGYHLGPHRGRGLEARTQALRAEIRASAAPLAARARKGGER